MMRRTFMGCPIKGKAAYATGGKLMDALKAMVEKLLGGAASFKCTLIIAPEKAVVPTPGADNKKIL